MKLVASLFLRAKHWQIFLLLFGALTAAELAMMSSIVATSTLENSGHINLILASGMLIFTVCFLGWFWSMGSFLTSIVQPVLRLRMGFFRFAVVFPAIYIPVFIALLQNPNPTAFAVILPFHFFAMYCMFYLLYFVSKSLVLAETGKSASFYDYAGPFFLIWFYPVGVWIIQPRINRLYAQHEDGGPLSEVASG